ncbi:type VI secretion system baseplate subunit TssE [Dyella monticola]|uniref:Type VI secretion system baseplate subunit TssE n=1 Tax=Dyella monticola TaxID=1927958 RepID=A0A370X620_9GAMM|nr:type VI secretion system baseplate subunit TssE [Dyella monticola]RDS83879.1 type VI secretion system baseplate subunit TssE [Dyella monticola]
MNRSGPGLFEKITGHFANGTAVDDFDPATQTFLSVQDNIQRILNSRRNGLLHIPDYGLDDLTEVYRDLPASTLRLKRVMEQTLLKYEPRLKAIDIEIADAQPGVLLNVMLTCHLQQTGLVRFGTHFLPDGKTRLTLLKSELERG